MEVWILSSEMGRLISRNGSSVSVIVDVNWSAGGKLETKSIKFSSSSLWHEAAPTMSSMPIYLNSEMAYLSIIPPSEHNFEYNTLVSRLTPESIILYFSSIIRETLFFVAFHEGIRSAKLFWMSKHLDSFDFITEMHEHSLATLEINQWDKTGISTGWGMP